MQLDKNPDQQPLPTRVAPIGTIKEIFLDYHRGQGFRIHESFPLVADDPTVLFTNATITPFKAMFTGASKRENFALVQKCLRMGGTGGNVQAARLNPNYTSIFDMLGSGLFDLSQDHAVAYFVDVLTNLGLQKEQLVFTTVAEHGFDSTLLRAGISPQQIRIFKDPRELQHEWSFGEGDLHGCGVVAWYKPDRECQGLTSVSVLDELARYVQIGRIVHIDGICRGANVETFAHSAYDMGLGLGRIELALTGGCQEFLRPWTSLSRQFKIIISGLSEGDAHYMANLYRVIDELVSEGLAPGSKSHGYALRKAIRLLIEESWLQSGALVSMHNVLDSLAGVAPCSAQLTEAIFREEIALRRMLSGAEEKLSKHGHLSPEELRSTFGIRASLLGLR